MVFTSVAYFDKNTLSTVIVINNIQHGKMSIIPFMSTLLCQFPKQLKRSTSGQMDQAANSKTDLLLQLYPSYNSYQRKQLHGITLPAPTEKELLMALEVWLRHVHNTVLKRVNNVQNWNMLLTHVKTSPVCRWTIANCHSLQKNIN